MGGRSDEDKNTISQKKIKTVHFELDRNIEHVVESVYPKGPIKPSASVHQETKFPVNIQEKKQVRKFLENHDEQYKGFILTQYRNQQDGTYSVSFIDPQSRAQFKQTFMQDRIDEILEEMRKIKSSKLK